MPKPIPGISFFPGGYGLYREDKDEPLPAWPKNGVMVLGHDFHSEDGYWASIARGREAEGQPTWRNLLPILRDASIPVERCFFTNTYMGLRQGSESTGRFPGADDEAFKARCRGFLRDQVEAQRPRLILTLGKWVPSLLAPLAPQLAPWTGLETFKEIDAAGALVREVRIGVVSDITVVSLTHPSLWHAAVRYRRYGKLVGAAAERRLLLEARDGVDL